MEYVIMCQRYKNAQFIYKTQSIPTRGLKYISIWWMSVKWSGYSYGMYFSLSVMAAFQTCNVDAPPFLLDVNLNQKKGFSFYFRVISWKISGEGTYDHKKT